MNITRRFLFSITLAATMGYCSFGFGFEEESSVEDEKAAEELPTEVAPVQPQPAVSTQPAISPVEYPPPYRKPRVKKGLLIAGIATFGGGWLFSMLVGYTMLSGDSTPEGTTCTNCKSVGGRLFIPLVGPFIAAPDADGSDGKAVCVIMGGVQVVGLVLTIAGGAVYGAGKRRAMASKSESLDESPRFSIDTAKLTSGTIAFSWR